MRTPLMRASNSATVVLLATVCAVVVRKLEKKGAACCPITCTEPVPLIAYGIVVSVARLYIRLTLLVTPDVASEPLVPPLPSCSVPAVMVVAPV